MMLFTKEYTSGNFKYASLRYRKAEILYVKVTLIAQSESGAYFIPLSTVRPITRPTYFDIE